jgi:hypothetical protein
MQVLTARAYLISVLLDANSVIMAVVSFFDTNWARGVLHVSTTLWWGPFLAFVAPDLPG